MASGHTISGSVNIQKVQDDVLKLWIVVKSQPGISQEQKSRIKALYEGVVRSLRKDLEPTRTHATPRNRWSSSQFLHPQISGITPISADKVPLLHLKRKVGASWEYSSNLTGIYLDILHEIATSDTIFKDKNALLTGSRYNRSTVKYHQSIYQTVGSCGSALTVVPFNQGSKQDVEALVDYIYATLGMDVCHESCRGLCPLEFLNSDVSTCHNNLSRTRLAVLVAYSLAVRCGDTGFNLVEPCARQSKLANHRIGLECLHDGSELSDSTAYYEFRYTHLLHGLMPQLRTFLYPNSQREKL
jgi:hypothetical protein